MKRMELVDRYLHAVEVLLPRTQREDILAELSANIQAHFEDREEQLGRPLQDNEQTDILNQLGAPSEVARRYSPAQEAIIGAAIAPLYVSVLKIVLPAAALVYAAVVAGLALSEEIPSSRVVRLLAEMPRLLIYIFGVLTIVFIALDRTHALDRWNRDRRIAIMHASVTGRRIEAAINLLTSAITAVVWLTFPSWGRIFGPAHGFVFGSAWQQFYPLFSLLAIASVALYVRDLMHPEPARARAYWGLGVGGATLLAFILFLHTGGLVVLSSTAASDRSNVLLTQMLNRNIFSTPLDAIVWIGAAALVYVVVCYYSLRRFAR